MVKNTIFGYNSARLVNLDLKADYGPMQEDKFAQIRNAYQVAGGLAPNGACGFIAKRTA